MSQVEPDNFTPLTTGQLATKHFVDTVDAMRRAQKTYFSRKLRDDLIAAKRLEAAVDLLLGQFYREVRHRG